MKLLALALLLSACSIADGSRLEPTGHRVSIPQGAQFCADNPGDVQCSR